MADNTEAIIEAAVVDYDDDDRNTTQLEHGETISLDNGYEAESEDEFANELRKNQELRNDMAVGTETW